MTAQSRRSIGVPLWQTMTQPNAEALAVHLDDIGYQTTDRAAVVAAIRGVFEWAVGRGGPDAWERRHLSSAIGGIWWNRNSTGRGANFGFGLSCAMVALRLALTPVDQRSQPFSEPISAKDLAEEITRLGA
jgi:hypothetical protein